MLVHAALCSSFPVPTPQEEARLLGKIQTKEKQVQVVASNWLPWVYAGGGTPDKIWNGDPHCRQPQAAVCPVLVCVSYDCFGLSAG